MRDQFWEPIQCFQQKKAMFEKKHFTFLDAHDSVIFLVLSPFKSLAHPTCLV